MKISIPSLHQFKKIPNCTTGCKVTGKRVNRGVGYGLETLIHYSFIGADKQFNGQKRT